MKIRERFIPYRRSDVVKMCIADNVLNQSETNQFKNFCEVLTALFHFELHHTLEKLKECYASFNPDKDTNNVNLFDINENQLKKNLEIELKEVLEKANYELVSQNDLDDALNSESLFKVKLHVDFNDFEEVLFFRRGLKNNTETVNKWFGLKNKILIWMYMSEYLYMCALKKKNTSKKKEFM